MDKGPAGMTKDPNRRRVRNHNGRMIDYDGIQLKWLLHNGYKLNTDETAFVADNNFKGIRNLKNVISSTPKEGKVKIQNQEEDG